MKLSIVMMVKNESKYLGTCLEALQPLRNGIESELIIVDTGSTDNTVEIARKYTHKVYFHTWNNDFAAMRNTTISYAKGQWLFVLDADEIMQDTEGIIKFFKSNHYKKYNVGMIKIKNYSKGKEELASETPAARLFKNVKEFRYEGAIHEQPTIKPPVYVLDTVLLHYGYDSADKDLMERKFIRNTEIIKKELEIDPENFYMWFQLSQSYAMYNDDKEAMECVEKAYEIGKAKEGYLGNRMYIYSQLARMYHKMEQYEKLEKACEKAINERDGYIDFYCMLGHAKQMLSKNEEAIESYQKYLELYHDYERSPAASDNASVTYMRNTDTYEKIHVHLSALYLKQKEYSRALEYVYKIQSKDMLKLALPTLISSYLALEEFNNLQGYYCKNILIENEELKYPFEACLEQHKKGIQEEAWQSLVVNFSKVNTEYGILNQIRLKDYMNQELEKQDVDLINQLDFNSLPEFYGEIIYRLLKRDYSISEITSKIREPKLISIFQYLANQKIQDLLEVILHYFKNSYPENSIEGCRIYKILGRILLISGQCSEQDYDAVFYRYVQEGIRYIGYTYHSHLIQQNKINFAKNDEDAFFMLMNYVQNIKDTKELEQIRILKIALEIYPDMKTGIGIFLQNIQQRLAPSYEQMKEYQLQFKANVDALILKGDLSQAKELLEEYKKSMKIDKDFFVFEANIALIEQDYDKAEEVLKTGLLYYCTDFDLLCNAAYLCQIRNYIEQAIGLYEQALEVTQNPEEKQKIQQIIAQLSSLDEASVKDEPMEISLQEAQQTFEDYKIQVKKQINQLILEEQIEEAKGILIEYEKLVVDDIEVFSLKAMIAMMEDHYRDAENILKKALIVDRTNFDILCNLGYLYEKLEDYNKALIYYGKAKTKASEEGVFQHIEGITEKIKIEHQEVLDTYQYTTRKKVLVIAYIFPPLGGSGVQRTLKFVKYLREFGWEPVVVTVGTTMCQFKDVSMISEIPDGVKVIRIDEKNNIDVNYANQLIHLYHSVVQNQALVSEFVTELNKSREHLNQLILLPDSNILWAKQVIDNLDDMININEMDMIYTTSGPYSDHIVGYYLKQRFNKPWVADFRDEWTNNPYVEFDKNHILYKMHFEMEKNIVNLADKIISVTPLSSKNYEKIFHLETRKIETITNGYDELDFAEISHKSKRNAKFTIMHNGMLYMIRTPLTFMQAVQKLIKNKDVEASDIKITFGWTENLDYWIKIRDELGLQSVVEFLGYMTHQDSLREAVNSDALLLIVGAGDRNKSVFPGKIFEYLRLCKPILALSPNGSVVDELISSTERGYNVDFDNINEIAKYILKLYKLWKKDELPGLVVNEKIEKYERKRLTQDLSNIFQCLYYESQLNGNNAISTEGQLSVIDNYFKKEQLNIHLFMGDMAIKDGRWEDAEVLFKKAIYEDRGNLSLLNKLAYIYEMKKEYLNALETYESIVFNMGDEPTRLEVIKIINKLEEDYRQIIQEQVEQREEKEEAYKEKNKNLHLMYDNQYCSRFMHFINQHFPNDEHMFVIVGDKMQKLKMITTDDIANVEILDLKCDLSRLLELINTCTKIFIHYLSDYFCEIVCKFDIKKPIYWPIWGGDLYYHIDYEIYDPLTKKLLEKLGFNMNSKVNKNSISHIFRRATIRKIKYCLNTIDEDFDILKENFITNAKCMKFAYPNPVEKVNMDDMNEIYERYSYLKGNYEHIILVGNSPDPSNNHLDIFHKLKSLRLKDYCVIVPLSYGGNDAYIRAIINEGKKNFGNRFIPLTEYMEPSEYYKLLNQVDVAIYYHNRQQAVGNIRLLSSLEKGVFLKENVTTFRKFKRLNLKGVKSTDKIDDTIFCEPIKESKNKEIIEAEFGEKAILEFLRGIF
ncbi:TDP-N-acetylfucosamine:lipid II N-acetylfucosaminyltransferase [Geosporobacter ferrireducens]|uniref:TDP-N-acetylfucosamine:lipid II N-acetylfucosaminyltransferase n=1 Tax=Geosporobacter ferrireducens TaxID=1424294 RepID=UPI00139DEAB7|nr:TDP-N-acetylfucosamine:lipid II N-acetylfucosaminyltransferase [Geosporobacter ferrireducens]MTI53431.1 glycosyltransferase [Geosporobacter ferrireducens]